MAYTKNTLSLLSQVVEGAVKKWIYLTADSLSTVLGAGYISDAGDHRMLVGDIVEVLSGTLNTTGLTEGAAVFSAGVGITNPFTAAPQYMMCYVTSISAGAATLAEISGGTTSASLESFFGATATTQPTSANEAAVTSTAITSVASTAPTSTTAWGFTTSTQALAVLNAVNSLVAQTNSLTTLSNQLRADLVTLGLIKGS